MDVYVCAYLREYTHIHTRGEMQEEEEEEEVGDERDRG